MTDPQISPTNIISDNEDTLPVTSDTDEDRIARTSPEYRDEVVEVEVKDRTETPSEEDNTVDTKYLDDNSVKLNIKDDDDNEATLPLNKKKSKQINASKESIKKKPPIYIFPILRLKLAWTSSSNILEFVLKVIAIAFSTLGWLCCVGGIPLMSLVMLIMGSIYVNDCKTQPNIPIYLIVSGAFGTLQHFIAVWTKYIPKDSPMRVYRAYCRVIDCTIQIFLIIWLVLGCIWVYGVPEEIDFRDTDKNEYCNKTIYYFAFWLLNISFILLLLLVVITLFAIICVISKKDEKFDDED